MIDATSSRVISSDLLGCHIQTEFESKYGGKARLRKKPLKRHQAMKLVRRYTVKYKVVIAKKCTTFIDPCQLQYWFN